MKLPRLQFLAACFMPLAVVTPVLAVEVDLAVTSFTAFQPSLLAPGGHPTSFTYSLHNYGPGSVGSGVGTGPVLVDLWLSSNSTFGDGDDLYLGQMQFAISSTVGSDGTYTHGNVNGLSGFIVPAGANGNYRVFLQITHPPASGRTDPDLSDNIGLLSGTITVGSGGDTTPPTVTSISRLNPAEQITSAASVIYRVMFSERVNNVSTADFTLVDVSGTINGESITSVSASSGTTFDVTVNTGTSGSGNLRLDVLVPGANITDDAGNNLSASFTGGQVYTIDRTAPEIAVSGNSTNIVDGDTTPSAGDHTDFGSADVSSGTVVRTFTIANTGNANLTVGPVTVGGTHAADFTVTQHPSSPVAPENSTIFLVTFDPSAAGLRTATLTFNNNDGDENPFNYSIQGTGTVPLPEVAVSGNSTNIADGDSTPSAADHTDFGSADVSGGMVVRTFTITNTGNASLTLGAVTVGGTHAADFTVTQQPSSAVAPGNSTTFQVTFDPSAAGLRSASLSFNNNDGDENPFNFTIQGTGLDVTPPTVTHVFPSLDRGMLPAGATSLRIAFSKPVTGGDLAENYQLQSLGPDALLGTADDAIVPVSATYAETMVTLGFAAISASVYRLTVRDTITDSSGIALDGNGDGTSGAPWVRDFVALSYDNYLFGSTTTSDTGGTFPVDVVVGEFNGDGCQDFVVANRAVRNGLAVMLGDGNGGFANPAIYYSGGYSHCLAVGDFNRDGFQDFAVGNWVNNNTGSVGILLGRGDGTFGAATTYSSGGNSPDDLLVADFNGDGFQDVALANPYGWWSDGVNEYSVPGMVGVMLGRGDGTFAPVVTFDLDGSYATSIDVGDFDEDGHRDLVVANGEGGGTIGVLLGRGNGSFDQAATYQPGYYNNSVSVADFDADGHQDLAVVDWGNASARVKVMLGRGDGTFNDAVPYSPGGTYTASVSVGDFDGDGQIDLAVSNGNGGQDGTVGVLLGHGDGTFATPVTFPSGGKYPRARPAVGDFNRDGRPDVVVVNELTRTLGVLLNTLAAEAGLLLSPTGHVFDVQSSGFMAGQLVQGPNNAFDGLNRLQVSGADYTPTTDSATNDGGRTVVTGNQNLAGLIVHREITVPATGNEDFARTVDVFQNPTGSAITTTVRIVGNLGSDAATTVFTTSDGDTVIETGDQWVGTDDGDGTGTSAIVHCIHGPAGLQPTSVIRTGDNIEWTYQLTVPADQTARLAHFTVLGQHRADAIAAANALVTSSGFGGQAGAFLSPEELDTLANFEFDQTPPNLVLTDWVLLGSGAFQFAFTNEGGYSFTVLTATNVSVPASNWTVLGSPVPIGGGVYQFTDHAATNHPQRFYRLRWP